ncbi:MULTISPECIES: hypothetical protein [Arcobacter]|uniref:Uncharacterized protein n=1 Tax=Arcobacter nitrofigilis (strain ATCC 33309 / DSM 7299 / CCUG 15893 / LMG 7604 / NCTC 12251 / CI) TaxID=572480 RepID=D5V1U6_ARCNC|nr:MULTISPECIES: hypothetical protein [Arcobacter]ADG93530.1 conserved hypothetical protein [Arcobacter nitrofigilis DSM 7299]RXJ79170.1 hypothetical protein CRU95_15120 [Arcobacter sp. F2176]
MEEKEYVIDEIKTLISSTGEKIDINPKFLDYFDLEELYDIKENLLSKKENFRENNKDFLEQIYEKTKINEI